MIDTARHPDLDASVQNYCAKALGSAVSSIGTRYMVRVLTLDDGRRVVAKITPDPAASAAHLSAAYRIQEGLRGMGVPCPKLLAGPEPLNAGFMIAVHEYFAAGEPHSCETPQHLKAVAGGLYRLKRQMEGAPNQGLAVLGPADGADVPELRAVSDRWAATAQSANDWAIMHLDFKARNLRFRGTEISTIYDFDSLRISSEAHAVGYSSVVFSGGDERVAINFNLATARAFVAAYEAARGKAFTTQQQHAAHGGMIRATIRMGRLLILGGATSAADLAARVLAFESEIQGSAAKIG